MKNHKKMIKNKVDIMSDYTKRTIYDCQKYDYENDLCCDGEKANRKKVLTCFKEHREFFKKVEEDLE